MSRYRILTQHEVAVNLSVPAMRFAAAALRGAANIAIDGVEWSPQVDTELLNFENLLRNLIERAEPENLDLIGG